ncbi:DUF2381 family protein [Archangium sp.]|uniref:DUF2381 family protein n=1 Tax=Archangium sp. TaxID=1872627 RepID=UPI00286B0E54|nr:DUF2381 family protein [Archangium sp.]
MVEAKECKPNERNIYLSDHTSREAPEVYVVGGLVTVLRLEQPCDKARTWMLAWEGRFEPVECSGKRVLIEPLRDLQSEDRLMLLVTLADGTELPFTVTSRQKTTDDRTGDQQVNVFRDREAPKAVLASLYDSVQRERQLREEVERYRKEDSVNHSLAGLLEKGATKQTPFRQRYTAFFKSPTGVEVHVAVLASRNRDKAAVVFTVKNNSPTEPWRLMEARLMTADGREKRPFALRASQDYWEPGGQSGQIAVVLEASAFDSKTGPDPLVLEIFRQGDGLRQAWVHLDKQLLR